MIIFLIIFIGFSTISLFSYFCFLYRNHEVCKERRRIIDKISYLAKIDIIGRRNWEWRYKEYNKISYEEMVYKFWIPVKDFYKNHKCISSIDKTELLYYLAQYN